MPLTQTQRLINTYGASLKNGTISNEELINLLDPNTFTKSEGYVDPNAPVSDSNHSKMDAIKDFVLTIGPTLDSEILHQLTSRMIELSPPGDRNTFMRGSSLEKAFLAFEMAHYPTKAEEHFNSTRVRTEFPGENDIDNLKAVILNPIIAFFQSPPGTDEKLEKLIKLCTDYKEHLKPSLTDDANNLVNKKHAIVTNMLAALTDSTAPNSTTKIKNMEQILTEENKATLQDRRDSFSGARFLESILHIISLGIYSKLTKGTFKFWKSHGEALSDNIEEVSKQQPGMK
ncbi:Dot/Icm T4SS effector VipE [Legionella pneumophila]|uniref:Dot/Icm T4SS effector VipE n=1 Tax=Legionella pneumophila TaxID=446 RepID=UPI000D0845D7|nr:Dot/Icm T4SS effector VipE [Legionella pneumophila]HAU1296599.1 Dot/Icm T4SS effector VipE [Legionella pneumophila]